MSRTVNGERMFGRLEMEVMRKQIWQIADFCGVQVLTYALLPNHFHVLVLVPSAEPVDDSELLRRYAVLYPTPTRFQTASLAVIRTQLASNGPPALAWRTRLLALMGDVSQFMKLLKQRFTRWFNRFHGRFGTLWAERFKSVLVQPAGMAVRAVAAYIDLNSVRARLAVEPAEYRFCGYAEAVSGRVSARAGLMTVMQSAPWHVAQSGYRQLLFGKGSAPRERKGHLTLQQLHEVIRQRGQLPLHALLRFRMRYFSDGAILGTEAFVQSQLALYLHRSGRRHASAHPLPPVTDLSGLAVLRRLRRSELPF